MGWAHGADAHIHIILDTHIDGRVDDIFDPQLFWERNKYYYECYMRSFSFSLLTFFACCSAMGECYRILFFFATAAILVCVCLIWHRWWLGRIFYVSIQFGEYMVILFFFFFRCYAYPKAMNIFVFLHEKYMTFLLWSYAIVEIKRVEFMCVQCYIFFISLLDLIIFRHIDFYWRLDASRTKCVCCTNIEQIDSNVIGLASIIPVWIHGIFSHLRECRKYSCQLFMYAFAHCGIS